MSTGQRYDLYSHDFRVSTHETYARMRDESPVHLPGLDGETPIWFVTRYDDVVALLTDNERFVLDPALAFSPEELAERRSSGALPDLDPRVNTSLLNLDGADHRRLRKLVTMALTPRIVEQLRPRIRQIADELVDRVAPSGRMELVDDFAFPLPITVIAELLGIPVEDQGRFRTWSSAFVTPALTPDPAALAALRSDVSRIPIAVEELLRFDSPVERTITRWVAADVELGGARLARGDLAIAVVGSANRDETQFTDADTLDLDRAENRHVGFGRGPHYCLGAPLARLETEIALETLWRRLPNLRLAIAQEDLYWRPIPIFRSLASLPVAWDV